MWNVLDLLKSPRLARVRRPHDVALAGERVPLHVVAQGSGWLRAGDVRRFVRGSLDEILFVPPGDVDVSFRNFIGRVVARVAAVPEVRPAPGRVRLSGTRSDPAATDDVVVERPEVSAPDVRVPLPRAARVSPRLRRARRASPPVPSLRRTPLRPRVRVPAAPEAPKELRHDLS